MTENANYENQECKGSELGVITVTLKTGKGSKQKSLLTYGKISG